MKLEDVPIVGKFVVLLGSIGDLAFHSGAFVFEALWFITSHVDMVYPLLRTLESLANRVPWLPAGLFDDLLTAALIAILLIEVGKLVTSYRSTT